MKYLLVFLAMLAPAFAQAHTTGAFFEQEVGDYIIDLGYDPTQPIAGDRLLLDIGLLNSDRTPAQFESVWVRLTQGSTTLLATSVGRQEFGPTTLLYMLPGTPGTLGIHVRYEGKDGTLAESSFELPVAPEPSPFFKQPWLLYAAAFALGAGFSGALMLRRRSATL